MPLCSFPPSDRGPDPICLSSTGQSTTPQAPWFWRVLERHLRARSVGDNQGSRPHGRPVPAAGVRPGADAAAASAGPSRGAGLRSFWTHWGVSRVSPQPQAAGPPAQPPSITCITLPSMETPPLVSVGTCSVAHPSQLPWSRGNIFTKNQTGSCSLGQPSPRSRRDYGRV